MSMVKCEIRFEDVSTSEGSGVCPGVVAVCSKCGHKTESCGQHAAAVKRCLAMMREECPNGEENFYKASDGEDEG